MKFFSHKSRFTQHANRDPDNIFILEIPDSTQGVFIRPLTDKFKEELREAIRNYEVNITKEYEKLVGNKDNLITLE